MLEELVSGSDWEPGGKLLVDHSEQNAAQITADKVASLADKATRLASMQLCMPVVLTSRSRSRLTIMYSWRHISSNDRDGMKKLWNWSS